MGLALGEGMDTKSEKALRLFVNPLTLWTDLVFKTGEAMLASAHAAALRANAPKVGVIPTADAPPLKTEAPKAAAPRQASKAARFKASRARVRSKPKAKRRSKR
jgi:hypothetical protein